MDKEKIKYRFKKAQLTYEEEAVVQRKICVKFSEILKNKSENKFQRLFEIGCGTGFMSRQLVSGFNIEEFLFNDIVSEMDAHINEIASEFNVFNYSFLPGDAEKITFPENCDLIVSTSTFQWISDLNIVFDKIYNSLVSGGIFAFTTFGMENLKEVKAATGIGLSYPDKITILKMLQKFTLLHESDEIISLDFIHPREVLSHMKNTGVNSFSKEPWTKGKLEIFCNEYSCYCKNGNVNLTYHPMYFILKKTQ